MRRAWTSAGAGGQTDDRHCSRRRSIGSYNMPVYEARLAAGGPRHRRLHLRDLGRARVGADVTPLRQGGYYAIAPGSSSAKAASARSPTSRPSSRSSSPAARRSSATSPPQSTGQSGGAPPPGGHYGLVLGRRGRVPGSRDQPDIKAAVGVVRQRDALPSPTSPRRSTASMSRRTSCRCAHPRRRDGLGLSRPTSVGGLSRWATERRGRGGAGRGHAFFADYRPPFNAAAARTAGSGAPTGSPSTSG